MAISSNSSYSTVISSTLLYNYLFYGHQFPPFQLDYLLFESQGEFTSANCQFSFRFPVVFGGFWVSGNPQTRNPLNFPKKS